MAIFSSSGKVSELASNFHDGLDQPCNIFVVPVLEAEAVRNIVSINGYDPVLNTMRD